jgi:GNAT superfamily N-acetyltransferase
MFKIYQQPFFFTDEKRLTFNTWNVQQSQNSKNPWWTIIDVPKVKVFSYENVLTKEPLSYCAIAPISHMFRQIYAIPFPPKTCVLKSVTTLPKYRRKGIAYQLLDKVCKLHKNKVDYMILETNRGNVGALELYKKLGFYEWTHPSLTSYKKTIQTFEEQIILQHIKNISKKELSDFHDENYYYFSSKIRDREIIVLVKNLNE